MERMATRARQTAIACTHYDHTSISRQRAPITSTMAMWRLHLVVHKQAVVQVEGVVGSVVHQSKERLVSTRADLRGLQMVIEAGLVAHNATAHRSTSADDMIRSVQRTSAMKCADLQIHGAEHTADGVRDELRARGQLVVFRATHLYHLAPLSLEKLRPAGLRGCKHDGIAGGSTLHKHEINAPLARAHDSSMLPPQSWRLGNSDS